MTLLQIVHVWPLSPAIAICISLIFPLMRMCRRWRRPRLLFRLWCLPSRFPRKILGYGTWIVHYESIDSYLSIPYFEVHVRVLYIHFMFNGYRQFQIGTAKIDAQYYFYSLKSSCCIGDLLNEMIIRNTNTNSNPTLGDDRWIRIELWQWIYWAFVLTVRCVKLQTHFIENNRPPSLQKTPTAREEKCCRQKGLIESTSFTVFFSN